MHPEREHGLSTPQRTLPSAAHTFVASYQSFGAKLCVLARGVVGLLTRTFDFRTGQDCGPVGASNFTQQDGDDEWWDDEGNYWDDDYEWDDGNEFAGTKYDDEPVAHIQSTATRRSPRSRGPSATPGPGAYS